jgi:hypothetical protein
MSVTVMSSGVKLMEKMVVEVRREVISECALLYGFSAEEAVSRLSAVELKVSGRRVGAKKLLSDSVKVLKSKFALPFSNTIRAECCTGVKPNRGLYSQCENTPKKDAVFCTGCANQCAKNASGEPDCGVIGKRLTEGSAWRDPKGNAPVSYPKVMKRLKLTEEQVLAEVARLGVAFNAEEHFAVIAAKDTKRGRPKKASDDSSSVGADDSKKRGRPKKAAKVVEVVSEDLFATLVENAKMAAPAAAAVVAAIVPLEEAEVSDISGSESEGDSAAPKAEKAPAKKKATKEEKDAESAAKKALKESELAEKKALKESELAEKKAAKEAAKPPKVEKAPKAEKAPKVPKVEKVEKAKKETKVEKKEAAAAIEAVKIAVSQSTEELVAEEEEEEEEEEEVKVEKFEFNGVTYLRSSNNVIYDSTTQDEIGVWNEAKKEITFCEPDSDEEEDA